MRRRRPDRDPETGEVLTPLICPMCELVCTPDGRECADCQHATQHPTIRHDHDDPWSTPPKDFT